MPVTVELTGDEARLLRSLQKALEKARQVEKGFGDVEKKGRDAGEKSGSAFDGLLPKLTAVGAVVGTLRTAFQLLTSEVKNLLDLQDKVKNVQLGGESAGKNLIRNMVGMDDATIKGVQQAAKRMSQNSGVSRNIIDQALAQGLSASGQNVPLTVGAVDLASRMLADDPSAIARSAGAMIDLAKVTGSSEAEVNAGYLLKTASLSRVVDPAAVAKSIPKALIGQRSLGAAPDDAAALFAAMSAGAADVTGESSGTASIRFTQQMREFFATEGIGISDQSEQISYLQTHAKDSRKFLKDLSMEAAYSGLAEQLVTDPNAEISRQYSANLKNIGTQDNWRQSAQTMMRQMNLAPGAELGALKRQFQTGTEGLLLESPQGVMGVLRDEVGPLLQAMGKPAAKQRISEIGMGIDSGLYGPEEGVGYAIDLLENEKPGAFRPPIIGRGRMGEPYAYSRPPGEPTARTETDRQQLEVLNRVLDTLKQIQTNLRMPGPSNVTLGKPGKDR